MACDSTNQGRQILIPFSLQAVFRHNAPIMHGKRGVIDQRCREKTENRVFLKISLHQTSNSLQLCHHLVITTHILSAMKLQKSQIPPKNGFTLIITISLLVLLTMIGIGLLSLSAVTLRNGSSNQARSLAQSNARLAMMIAIGELQKSTGPDTRITASADILSSDAPRLTGVWRSWEGTNHESNGRPIAPNYSLKKKSESDGGRFVDWLVSSAASLTAPSVTDVANLVQTSAQSGTIPLLATGSLPESDTRQIHVVPSKMSDNGSFAWWISGENQKASLAQPYEPRNNTVAGIAEMGQSHTMTNPEVFGMSALLTDREPYDHDSATTKTARKSFTRQTMAITVANNAKQPEKKFHDLTTHATGLLTNTATGGWRKDLSIASERWNNIYASYPGGKLPLFRYLPQQGKTSLVPRPTNSVADPAQSNFYPWSEYSTIIGKKAPYTYHAASASWESLVSFATSYKKFTSNGGTVVSPFVWDKISNQSFNLGADKMYNYKHVQRLYPQIARFQFLVYARAVETTPIQNPKRYNIQLTYVPIFVLWNPYNVTLEHTITGTLNAAQGSGQHTNFLGFGWRRSPPGLLAIANKVNFPNPDAVPNNQYKLLTPGNFQTLDVPNNNANAYDTGLPSNVTNGYNGRWVDKRTFGCWLPEGKLTFKPGEAKIFSPEWSDPAYGLSGVLRLREGYNVGNIVGSEFNAVTNVLATQSFWFLMKTERVTQPYLNRNPGYGFSLSFSDGSSHFGANSTMPTGPGEEYHNLTSLASEDQGKKYWPADDLDEVGYSVGELASGPWIPLYSISFGPRMTMGTGPGTKQNRPTKGLVQNNPLAAFALSDPASGSSRDHPANNPFDFAYHSLSIGSTITPNVSDSKAYIATGYQSGDGLSRLIMVDLPLRPMASLVELQGWNPRGQNPYPPFQMNQIGNSDATPMIPKEKIVPNTLAPASVQTNLQHDDAYCANQLLFDDWFLSSIAPDPTSFGNSSPKDITTVFTEFLQGDRKLVNRAYRPISLDSRIPNSEATKRVAQYITSNDGWLKIASRLEVEGMFNVNSTSVDAWKALFGHAKALEQIAMQGANGIVSTNVSNKNAVTRGPIASDIEAGTGAGFSGQFGNASEFTGFRNLSDKQIENLAQKVVEQVRLRGPFLSLSEFMNRQLSNDTTLALAGAVQTALNLLAEDPMAKLRNPANSLSDNTMDPNDPKLNGVGYEFAQAATGSSAFGAPAWIRQADILRRIAPILSVRDDTFTIRAYGDAKDSNGKVIAKAWCEAVVKRTRDFAHPSDAPDATDPPTNVLSTTFGRNYKIISFRWLNANEV